METRCGTNVPRNAGVWPELPILGHSEAIHSVPAARGGECRHKTRGRSGPQMEPSDAVQELCGDMAARLDDNR